MNMHEFLCIGMLIVGIGLSVLTIFLFIVDKDLAKLITTTDRRLARLEAEVFPDPTHDEMEKTHSAVREVSRKCTISSKELSELLTSPWKPRSEATKDESDNAQLVIIRASDKLSAEGIRNIRDYFEEMHKLQSREVR